jgi:hypothetical protein
MAESGFWFSYFIRLIAHIRVWQSQPGTHDSSFSYGLVQRPQKAQAFFIQQSCDNGSSCMNRMINDSSRTNYKEKLNYIANINEPMSSKSIIKPILRILTLKTKKKIKKISPLNWFRKSCQLQLFTILIGSNV